MMLADARGPLGRFAGLSSHERDVRGVRVVWFEAQALHLTHRAALALAEGAAPGALFASAGTSAGGCAGPFLLLRADIDLPRARLRAIVFAKVPDEAMSLAGELVEIAVSTSERESARVLGHDEA
jgi:hypothetical protein